MRVLVPGGGGYLGCRLVPLLLERGYEVRIFDRLVFGEAPLAEFIGQKGVELVRGDVRHLDQFPNLLEGVGAIIHLAGLSNDPSCDLDEDMALHVNLHASITLAKRAAETGVRRFVMASSCSVYGHGLFSILTEESPTNPVSIYAESKLRCEHAILPMASNTFEPVFARPATLFGWSPRMRFDLVINLMTAKALADRKIQIMGGGKQWRPLVHVADAARGFIEMMEAPAEKVAGQVFNLGSNDNNHQVLHIAETVATYFDDIDLEMVAGDEDRRTYHVRFDKIRETLGFVPEYSIGDGIEEVRDGILRTGINPFDETHFNVRRMKTLLTLPVAQGGEPVAPSLIKLAPPSVGQEEEDAAVRVLRSGWLTTGAEVDQFETAFAERVEAKHAIAVSSCTAAIQLALAQAGVGRDDEVITPSITWLSTGNTLLHMGAKIVFADVDPNTLNVDPESIRQKITKRTRAIIPVHLGGLPCDLDAIQAIADEHGIAVIEDAAHALGAQHNGRAIGGIGRFSCFSFYPVKNITTVEGGIITTNDDAEWEQLRILANDGRGQIAWDRYGPNAIARPAETIIPGFKCRMNNLAAAIGNAQLAKLDRFLALRRHLAETYLMVLPQLEEIEILETPSYARHAWHLMIIRLKEDKLRLSRDEIAHALRQENVQTGLHFYGLHLHQYYREHLGWTPEDLPHATAASRSILSLPLHPEMTDRHVSHVIQALKKVLHHAR